MIKKPSIILIVFVIAALIIMAIMEYNDIKTTSINNSKTANFY